MRHDPDHPKGALLLEQTVQCDSNFLKLVKPGIKTGESRKMIRILQWCYMVLFCTKKAWFKKRSLGHVYTIPDSFSCGHERIFSIV